MKNKNVSNMEIIKRLMKDNNGYITSKILDEHGISRYYLQIMMKKDLIIKISRGIYLDKSVFEDSYLSFQQRYKKAIFSHMNALYFHGMTEEFPYEYTITVPRNYNINLNHEKYNIFYVSDDIYELGLIEVETPNGNKVKAYDKERCICDIIRSRGRQNIEQVYKSIRDYKKSKDKDYAKLYEYAEKIGINDKVAEMMYDRYDN